MNIRSIAFLLASAGIISSSHAAVTIFAEYHLGEAGSLGSSNRPQDSSGNARHFSGAMTQAGSATVGTTNVYAPGSSAYLNTSDTANNAGWWGANNSTLATDNFAFGIYTNAATLTNTSGIIFALGDTSVGAQAQAFQLALSATGWQASSGSTQIGSTATFTADQWVHLAVIRNNGVSTFYVNGVAQGSTFAGAPTHGTGYMSVDPGGAIQFDGLLDEARVVTFTAGESNINVLNSLQGVPEPSVALLGGLGLLGLLRRRRN